jgi:putative transcriptional regulator
MSGVRLRLPVLRAERRLSQRQLAALAGVRPDTVSALERGDTAGIRFDTLARLCDVLDCEPGAIFELDRDPHSVPVLGGPDEDDIVRRRLSQAERRADAHMADLPADPPSMHGAKPASNRDHGKQAALQIIEAMPNDASFEEIMYGLYFRQRVDRGLRELDAGETVPHDEVKRSVAEWLRSAGR